MSEDMNELEELQNEVDVLGSLLEDMAWVVVGVFDIVASTQQASDRAIEGYNRIARAIGHEAPNNIFFDQVEPEEPGSGS